MFNYRDQTALITGASTGLGATFARELAGRGMNTILVARSADKLQAIAQELQQQHGHRHDVIAIDLSLPQAADKVFQQVQELGLSVDLLINNAGFATYGNFDEIEPQRDQEQVMLNVTTLVDMTHAFIPQMVARGSGGIINLSSVLGFQPVPYMAVYGATKAFVLSFSEGLWGEYRSKGIQVVALCPGATVTPFHDIAGQPQPPQMSTPEEVILAGLKALDQQQSYVIPGKLNFLLSGILPRFLPRSTITMLAKKVMQTK
jgi:uncharacterized protein